MIETERLLIRQWRDADRERFAALNADPSVMEFFPHPLSRVESDHLLDRLMARIDQRGWGLWAAERKSDRCLIGFIGLSETVFDAPFTPCVEIGWRLSRDAWGTGFATEGARAVLRYAFETLGLKEVVSFTTEGNHRSRRVMEKLGMHHDVAGDFLHPNLAPGHPQSPHVLYRLRAQSGAAQEPENETPAVTPVTGRALFPTN